MKRFFAHCLLGFVILDLLLLDRVAQPLVDWLGRRWGVDFIKLGIGLFNAGALIDAWHLYLMDRGPVFWALLGLTYCFWTMIFWGGVRFTRLMRGKFNYARIGLFGSRIIFVFLVIFDIALFLAPPFILRTGLSIISTAFVTFSFYVLSCQSPPPKERREPFWSKWLSPAPA